MNLAAELVERVELAGGTLALHGDRITYDLPEEIAPMLEELRAHRDEVVRVLQQRQEVPAIPPGVRLIGWNLKEPPVAIETCSVVIDPARFAKSTLLQLQAALKGKRWLAGHWTTVELIERLKQVGVEVEMDS